MKEKVRLLINKLDQKEEFDEHHKIILIEVVIKAYEYLRKNLQENYKDYSEFEKFIGKRLHSIELSDSIGNERTNGKYQSKKIILKKALLTDNYLFMFIFAHELSHCISESLFAIGLIPSAPLLGFIARRFPFHYINELQTDYIAIQILESDSEVIEHKIKLYNKDAFYDASLFYKGNTYPEFSWYADGVNFVYTDLRNIYVCKNRSFKELLIDSELKEANKLFLDMQKKYKKYLDSSRTINGVECFSYDALKALQCSFERFIISYLDSVDIQKKELDKLIDLLASSRFFIRDLNVCLNDDLLEKLNLIIRKE